MPLGSRIILAVGEDESQHDPGPERTPLSRTPKGRAPMQDGDKGACLHGGEGVGGGTERMEGERSA